MKNDTIIDHQYHPDYDSVIVLNNIIDSLNIELRHEKFLHKQSNEKFDINSVSLLFTIVLLLTIIITMRITSKK